MKIKVEISYINAKNKFNITNNLYTSIRMKNIHVVLIQLFEKKVNKTKNNFH